MISAAQFRRMALACAGVVERAHMGHPDFRAFERIFASIQNSERGALKLTPDQQAQVIADAPAAFVAESGAWGRQGWTRVMFAEADEEAVGDALTLAWQNNAVAATSRATKKQPSPPSRTQVAAEKRKPAAARQTAKAPAANTRSSPAGARRSAPKPTAKRPAGLEARAGKRK